MMQRVIEEVLEQYESGRLTRRELIAGLAGLATCVDAVLQQSVIPITARTLNHVTLRVSNVERSVRFYQQLFGFRVVNRQQNSVGLGVGTSHIGDGFFFPEGRVQLFRRVGFDYWPIAGSCHPCQVRSELT
jgi:glyoxalase/bleomycin resistance protein/dioxygenase superfamily protein